MNNSENKYQHFTIKRQSGTYSDALEAFGLASLLEKINNQLGNGNAKVTIENKGTTYVVSNSHAIEQVNSNCNWCKWLYGYGNDHAIEQVENLKYFQVIKFIKTFEADKKGKQNTKFKAVPIEIGNDYFDYVAQRAEKDAYNESVKEILKEKDKELLKKRLDALKEARNNEFGKKIDKEYDVYSQLIGNPYVAFCDLYDNFDKNKANFPDLLKEILDFYTLKEKNETKEKRKFKIEEKVTAQQLLNPNQGKGLNQKKADNANMKNLDGNWISETMKIAGAFEIMFCQNVKVSSTTYDTKIFVPDFKNITLKVAKDLQLDFKKHLKSVSPVKLDIMNLLSYTQEFIKLMEEYRKKSESDLVTGKIKNTIGGFYSVYQKDLGQNKAVANISYLEIPNFIEFETKKEGAIWLEILNEQKDLVSNITEQGDAIQGLLAYRNFISSSNLDSFFKFNNWYSVYLMQSLAKNNRYVRFFIIETLNKFYTMLDKNNNCRIKEIINNQGFLAVAKAIRQSTVVLQSLPKGKRKFEIRYGVAQQIQNKSKSCDDLIAFIGDFIATYNAETSKFTEKVIRDEGKELARANVKIEELNDFYALFETHSPKILGSLLASYGFAKPKKDDDKVEKLKALADELGYEVIKIDTLINTLNEQNPSTDENNI